MKKIFLTVVTAVLFLFGCSDVGVNPRLPVNNSSNNTTMNKKGTLVDYSESQFSVTQTINGNNGGIIMLNNSSGTVSVSASLKIRPHSFEGSETITMTVDPLTASVYFSPSMAFEKKLKFNLALSGLDLGALGYSQGKLNFYYQADDGTLTLIKQNGVDVDLSSGSIYINDAEIYHFSRYIWAK